MRTHTVKSYALRRFEEGASTRQVVKEVEEKFPHLIAGWNYITKLERDFRAVEHAEAVGKQAR